VIQRFACEAAKQELRMQNRRRFLAGGILSAIAGLFAKVEANASEITTTGTPMTTHMRQGNPPTPPLDTMLLFERGDEENGKTNGTRQVLSLIHEEKSHASYPWTIYASLDTHHEIGDACVLCSRLHKNGPGWSTGLHSEVFNHARAVAIGTNIEMSNDAPADVKTDVIGMNIQAVSGTRPLQYAIHIHDHENMQTHFETAIALDGRGTNGVDLSGKFDVGINTHDNSIRLNEGACIELDGKGQIKVRYKNGRIEFLNGDKCFGHLDVNGEDRAL
jgi:hypothetical protein